MKRENGEPRTQEWQEWQLDHMVEKAFIRTTQGVKGPYTTADFVMWLLNEIFGPSNWSFQVLKGPELVTYSNAMGYSQATVRLTVRFANGSEVVHEELGVWPLRATRSVGTLDKTAPEVYEQVLKSAVTDGLKACTDHIGNCFRPIADQELENFLRQRQAAESLEDKGLSAAGESATKSANDLFGDDGGSVVEPTTEPEAMDDSITDPAPYPRTISELYSKADQDLGIPPKSAAEIIQAHLDEQHGEGANIGAYVKNGGGEAVIRLWKVVKESIT